MGSFLLFREFAPTDLFSTPTLLGDFPSFSRIYSNQLASCSCSIGGFSLIFKFLLQPACFLLLPTWSFSSLFLVLLQLTYFLLLLNWGIFPYFRNLLQLACFLLLLNWGNFPYFGNLLQLACFLLLFHWGSFPHFQIFAPTSLLPAPIHIL